jgi:hypothetical protein
MENTVIRPIDTSLLDAVAKQAGATSADSAPAATGKNAFSAHLRRESDKSGATSTPTSLNRAAPAEGEKWRPVEGRDDYAEIVAGDRKGQFVNLNRGGRKGEAFTIEEQDGKTFHVYKREGKDDLRVEVVDNAGAKAARTPHTKPPKNETWAPVSGTSSYADILTGSRNGWYVNISQGSSREGETFHIVKRGGKEYHVYGAGDDAVMVEVGKGKKKDEPKAAETDSTTGTSTQTTSGAADSRDASTTSTGGTSAAAVGKPVA